MNFWTEFVITASLLYAGIYIWKLCNFMYRYIHKIPVRICACGSLLVCLYLKLLESWKCSLHNSTLLISTAHLISFRTESNLRNHKTEWSCWFHEIRAITATLPTFVKYLQVKKNSVSFYPTTVFASFWAILRYEINIWKLASL